MRVSAAMLFAKNPIQIESIESCRVGEKPFETESAMNRALPMTAQKFWSE